MADIVDFMTEGLANRDLHRCPGSKRKVHHRQRVGSVERTDLHTTVCPITDARARLHRFLRPTTDDASGPAVRSNVFITSYR